MSTETDISRKKRVLLVDDDPLQLRVREAVLRDSGVPVDVATTADSALALLRTASGDSIAAVVTDHIMPGISGAVFIEQLRSLKPGIPVIVISGMAEAENEYEGYDVLFRTKPCPPAELIALVRAQLRD